jgi:phosphotransferase system  glucose/maltose/N-acetylglucosamine-specific IIC component
MNHITDCMTPIIPSLIAGSLLKLLILILAYTGVLQHLGQTEQILTVMSNAPFYFLPILVAYSCSKHFHTDTVISLTVVSVFFMPDLVKMMGMTTSISFFGIPVYHTTYEYSIVPIILLVFVQSYIEKGLKHLIPEKAKIMLLGITNLLLTSTAGILFIGPMGAFISQYLSKGVLWLQDKNPILAWGLLSAMIPLLLITGMHWIFISVAIAQIGQYGVDNGIMSCFFVTNMAIAGTVFAVMLKTKNEKIKHTAFNAGITVFLVGTSEPALYGVCIPQKKPLVIAMIASGFAGIYLGIVTVHCYLYTFPGMLAILMFYGKTESDNMVKAVISAVIAFIAAFVITILMKEECRDESSIIS